MARRKQDQPPAYLRHKASGQAVVYLNRRTHYLGRHGSPESHEAYERLLAQWRAAHAARLHSSPFSAAGPLTINELLLAYFRFAAGYYVGPNGERTNEFDEMRYAAQPLRRLYGSTLVRDFGPKSLQLVRQHLVDSGRLCRWRERVIQGNHWLPSQLLADNASIGQQSLFHVHGKDRGVFDLFKREARFNHGDAGDLRDVFHEKPLELCHIGHHDPEQVVGVSRHEIALHDFRPVLHRLFKSFE